ncbi:MAG TPA: hypothetical protein VLU43_14360 [Anaeromyxobacteraceae bacterium]|nr:hypothetical protein [Anaeromyxobacteraceae bacterium]
MTPRKITLLCLPIAAIGAGVAVHATLRIRALEGELEALAATAKAEGESFLATLQGEHAERQRVAFVRRREVALSLASARRDRLLGALGVGAAGLVASALSVMSRIAAEIEEDRRHLHSQTPVRGPDRS